MAKDKSVADQIGDDIVDIENSTDADDDPIVGTPPLDSKEYPDSPADPPEGDDEGGEKVKTEQTLAGGQFPATSKGIAAMERALSVHQSAADKHKATLVEAGYVEAEDGTWIKPAAAASATGAVAPGFDPVGLAMDLLGPPVESDDNDVPKDYDPSNPLHVKKLMRSEVRADREHTQQTDRIVSEIKELVEQNPGITEAEIRETVDWYKGGGLRLASLHAIHHGKSVSPKTATSEVNTSEAVNQADKDAAVAAALKDLEAAQKDRENIVPGSVNPGSGPGGETERTVDEEIGDDIVSQSARDGAKRI